MAEKIDRSAFLYLPAGERLDDKQCGHCMLWVKDNRCVIHAYDVKVTADMSCGFYLFGEPSPKHTRSWEATVTPEESGLVDRQVRCENCEYGSPLNRCRLYEMLNRRLPDIFDLDVKIESKGCCNAQTPKSRSSWRLKVPA